MTSPSIKALLCATALSSTLLAAPAAQAQTTLTGDGYTFTTYSIPGATGSIASGINDAGTVVGTYYDAGGSHGFRQLNGLFKTIDWPGADVTGTRLGAINNANQYVGTADTATGREAIIGQLKGARAPAFNIPGATSTMMFGINDSATTVGYATDADGTEFSFTRTSAGTVTRLNLPQGYSLSGINNAGTLVGQNSNAYALTGTDYSALQSGGFVGTPGNFTNFTVPGYAVTETFGISNTGIVIGDAFDPTTQTSTAWLRKPDGTFNFINPTGGFIDAAMAINDLGQFVGDMCIDATGTCTAFIATPDSMVNSIVSGPLVALVNAPTSVTVQGSTTAADGSQVGYAVTPTNGSTAYTYQVSVPGSAAAPVLKVEIPIRPGTTFSTVNDVAGFTAKIETPQAADWSFVPSGTDGKDAFAAPAAVLVYTANTATGIAPGAVATGFGFASPLSPANGPFQLVDTSGTVSFIDPPIPAADVPEPASLGLLGIGLAATLGARRRRA